MCRDVSGRVGARVGEGNGAEPMNAARRSHGSRSHQAPPANGAARLTARGAITVLFVVSLLGIAIAQFFDQSWASGLVFVIGCGAACLWVRPSDTPMLVVAPPIVYFLALLVVETVSGLMSGMFVQVAAVGVALNLSEVLFWLLGGTVLSVVILLLRGLPRAWSDLRADLRGDREDDEDPEPYGGAADYGRPAPRRPAPPYGGGGQPYAPGQQYPGQRPVPPRPQRPGQWNAPPPPRGYQPRPPGYGHPPQPGGYR